MDIVFIFFFINRNIVFPYKALGVGESRFNFVTDSSGWGGREQRQGRHSGHTTSLFSPDFHIIFSHYRVFILQKLHITYLYVGVLCMWQEQVAYMYLLKVWRGWLPRLPPQPATPRTWARYTCHPPNRSSDSDVTQSQLNDWYESMTSFTFCAVIGHVHMTFCIYRHYHWWVGNVTGIHGYDWLSNFVGTYIVVVPHVSDHPYAYIIYFI